jgi:hypothetical protein
MSTIVLAGRRIDAEDAEARRFPLCNAPLVEGRLHSFFAQSRPLRLICSAACGADLLALKASELTGIPRRTIVIPYSPAQFYETSVADRPGDWRNLYFEHVERAQAQGELIVLNASRGSDEAYSKATAKLVLEASHSEPPHIACIVWEGQSQGDTGQSMDLKVAAECRHWQVEEIMTV